MFFKVFLLETYPFMNFLLYVFLEGPHQKYMQKMCVCYICSEMGHDRLSYIFCKQTRKSKVLSLSVVSDSEIPQIIARQVPLSMGFSRQEYWSGLSFLSPGNLPDPGIEPRPPGSPELQADSLPLSHWEVPFVLGDKRRGCGCS